MSQQLTLGGRGAAITSISRPLEVGTDLWLTLKDADPIRVQITRTSPRSEGGETFTADQYPCPAGAKPTKYGGHWGGKTGSVAISAAGGTGF